MSKRILYVFLVSAGLFTSSVSQAADITLRFGSIWPAVASAHKNLLQVWAETIEQQSKGRIKVDMYPSSTLAKPPAQYEAVKNQVMDITATVLGYSANRFPLAQIVEVPGLARNGVEGSCVVQSLYDEGLLSSEFEDTHPIFFFTHGPGLLHTKDKLIKEPKDLAGLRIRRPTTLVADLLQKFDAQAVGMPAPSSYQSMQRGVIDGVAFPWEATVSFRLNELANMHTELGGLYNLVFVVTMNKSVYNDLPTDVKAVLDANTGKAWAKKAGEVFDASDVVGRKQALDAGHTIYTVEGGINNPAWKPALSQATEDYLSGLESKKLPARKIYNRALELVADCKL